MSLANIRCEESALSPVPRLAGETSCPSSVSYDEVKSTAIRKSAEEQKKAESILAKRLFESAMEKLGYAGEKKDTKKDFEEEIKFAALYDGPVQIFKRVRRRDAKDNDENLQRGAIDPRIDLSDPLVRAAKAKTFVCALEARRLASGKSATFAACFDKVPCRVLGAGTYSEVIAAEPDWARVGSNCWSRVAIKATRALSNDTTAEYVKDTSERLQLALESRIMDALSRHILGIGDPSRARCPNFLAQVAFEQNNTAVKRSEATAQGIFCTVRRCKAVHMTMLGEVCDEGSLLDVAVAPSTKRDANVLHPLRSRRGFFSAVAQVLLGIATHGRCGISHNDLNLSNIFVHSLPFDSVITYELPSDASELRQEFPGGKIHLRAAGRLHCIADYGLASVEEWADEDPRISGYWDSQGSLFDFYYGDGTDVTKRTLLPVDMLMVHEERTNDWQHPLVFTAVKNYERDVASFVSHMVVALRAEEDLTISVRANKRYALAILRQLEVQRPRQRHEILRFVHSVLRPSFVARHYTKDFLPELYEQNEYRMRDQHCYKLPTLAEGAAIQKELCANLSDVMPPHCYWTCMDD